jgi:hypothetical protein
LQAAKLLVAPLAFLLLAASLTIAYAAELSSVDLDDDAEPVEALDYSPEALASAETVTATVVERDVKRAVLVVETAEGERLVVKLFRSYVDLANGYFVSGRWIVYSLNEGDEITLTIVAFRGYGVALHLSLPDGREVAHTTYLAVMAGEG